MTVVRARRLVALLAVVVLAGCGTAPTPTAPATTPPTTATPPAPTPGGSSTGPDQSAQLTLSAVGDVIMGNAPSQLPPNNGHGFFDDVAQSMHADLQMANLEQPLTDDTGVGKCGADTAGRTCFQFRSPPSYANVLKEAGFALVNLANNHAYDFGPAGHQNTRKALDTAGVKYTGPPGMITVVTVQGIKVAVVGFAPYPWANDLVNIPKAEDLVRQAKAQADLGIPGTGTCTDATVVSCPPQGPVEGYGGPRSTWGARLARAAYEAIVRGGRDWLADPRSWSAAVVGPEDAAAAPASHGAAPTAPGADNAAVAPDSAAVAPDSAAVAADPNRGAGALLASGIVRTDASLRPRTNPT